jgi:hypothetical protein
MALSSCKEISMALTHYMWRRNAVSLDSTHRHRSSRLAKHWGRVCIEICEALGGEIKV